MYTIRYEEYTNDYTRSTFIKNIGSLQGVEDWIFDQMQQTYERMYFPVNEPSRIEFSPSWRGPSIWIHMITSDRGIEFTDGTYTNGQKHWSNTVHDWLINCKKRQKSPQFVFVE